MRPCENEFGINVIDYRVLVRPDTKADKTDGGLIIPELSLDREQVAMQRATVIDISPQAFRDQDWRGDEFDDLPKIGDRVLIERHAGGPIEAADGTKLRIIMATAIMAVIDEDVEKVSVLSAQLVADREKIDVIEKQIEKAMGQRDEAQANFDRGYDDPDRLDRMKDLIKARGEVVEDLQNDLTKAKDDFRTKELDFEAARVVLHKRSNPDE